jgi:hypothetical protein
MILKITLPTVPFPEDIEITDNSLKIEELINDSLEPTFTTFFTINAISPFKTPYGDYTIVFSGGTEFLCTYSHGELYDKLSTIYTQTHGVK